MSRGYSESSTRQIRYRVPHASPAGRPLETHRGITLPVADFIEHEYRRRNVMLQHRRATDAGNAGLSGRYGIHLSR